MATETDKPVTQLQEMLQREIAYDRSLPMEPRVRQMLEDVLARAERAEVSMRIGRLGMSTRSDRYKHLLSKEEGVKLIISYIEEELRMATLASAYEGRDDGLHDQGDREDRAGEATPRPGDEAGQGELGVDPRAEQGPDRR